MKHIRSVALGFALLAGTATFAAAQSATPPQAQRQHAKRGKMGPGAGNLQRGLFRGITLSDAEKSRVQAIETKYKAELKARHDALKPQLDAARQARQRGDTAALKAMREKNAAQRAETKKLLESARADYRAALTPENQAKFDANAAKMEQRMAKRVQDGKRGKVGAQKGPRA